MTVQPLAPVIPSFGVPVPSAPEGVVYGIARIDSSGRICERAIVTALGWAGGDLLMFTADAC
jgi:coenzyme F420-reducing hydrogenase alpha subunit